MCNKASDYNRKLHQYCRAHGNIARDCQSAGQMSVLTGYSTKTMGFIGCLSFKTQQLAGFTSRSQRLKRSKVSHLAVVKWERHGGMSVAKASFVQRLKCLSVQYSQSASFILPAHEHGGIISYRRIEKEKNQAKDGETGDYKRKEIIVWKGNRQTEWQTINQTERQSKTKDAKLKFWQKWHGPQD